MTICGPSFHHGNTESCKKFRTKILLSTGYSLSTWNQQTPLMPLIYLQIHVTIFPPMAKLLRILITTSNTHNSSILGLHLTSWQACWCTEQQQKGFGNLTLFFCKMKATFFFCFVQQHGSLITWAQATNSLWRMANALQIFYGGNSTFVNTLHKTSVRLCLKDDLGLYWKVSPFASMNVGNLDKMWGHRW